MVTMPWANESAPLKGSADRFPPATKFNDKVFVLLMLANILAVGVMAATDLPGLKAGSQQQQDVVDVPASSIAVGFAIVLFPSLITGVASIAFFFFLMQKVDAGILLKTTLGLSLGMLVVLVGFLLAVGALPAIAAVLLLIVGIIALGWLYYMTRGQVKFTGACFEVSMAFFRRHPSTLVVGLVSLVPATCWAVLVSLCLYANQQKIANVAIADMDTAVLVVRAKMLFLTISLYWVWQYMASTVHVIVSGAFASWYFFGSRASSVVLGSLSRGLWSAGSVCFGSLIVSMMQLLMRAVGGGETDVHGRSNQNPLAQMVWSCAGQLINFCNKYAFCYVAIYGQSFTEAGKSVYSLFERHCVATLISNGTTDLILTMAAFVGGVFGMIVTGVVAIAVYGTSGVVMIIMTGGALVSGGLVYFVMQTVDSCVATLFVCFVEDPAALSVTAPEAYEVLSAAWGERYPEFSKVRANGAF